MSGVFSPPVFLGNFAWANRPACNAAPLHAIIFASDVGFSGGYFRNDGTYWRPLNGRLNLWQYAQSFAAPISVITGVASGSFVLPNNLIIPAGLICPFGRLWMEFRFRRTTAVATAVLSSRLGVFNNIGDAAVYTASAPAVANQDVRVFSSADFALETNQFSTHSWGSINGTGSGASGADRVGASIDTTLDMFVSCHVAGANVADSFGLIAYNVTYEG